jgi:deferrochelatase/peroxidase EfeB
MSEDDQQHNDGPRVSRRALLGMAGVAGGGVLLGAGGYVATRDESGTPAASVEPFHGDHQAGITTKQQKYLQLAAFDVADGGRGELRGLMRDWTDTAATLAAGLGKEPYTPARLTFTFGLGPGVFADRFGLTGKRPPPMIDIPPFPHDQLNPAFVGGDLGVQVCSNDQHTALLAMRDIVTAAQGAATVRWRQTGFVRDPLPGEKRGTPRNLFGFKDGTNNLDATDAARMRRNVWVSADDGPAWMSNGCYLVVRRIEMDVDGLLHEDVSEQERAVGRQKASGAPLNQAGGEFTPVDPSLQPVDTHIMRANQRKAGSEDERILRRGYNFADGYDAEVSMQTGGLVFMAYQRDPRRQFLTIQRRLAHSDRLQHHLFPRGSAIFAVPPGVKPGGYVGETLLA